MKATLTDSRSGSMRKRESQRAVRRNISLPPTLDAIADQVALKFGFSSFSDYVQGHLRKDGGLDFAA